MRERGLFFSTLMDTRDLCNSPNNGERLYSLTLSTSASEIFHDVRERYERVIGALKRAEILMHHAISAPFCAHVIIMVRRLQPPPCLYHRTGRFLQAINLAREFAPIVRSQQRTILHSIAAPSTVISRAICPRSEARKREFT